MTSRCVVALVGGTGFLGRHIAARLRAQGPHKYTVRIGSRNPQTAADGATAVLADVTRPETLRAACDGAHVVVSLAGYLHASAATFDRVQRDGAAAVAVAARDAGARLVHVSALGADAASSVPYWCSKAQGERAVRAALPDAVVLRPSLVFGPGDEFFGRFAKLARVLPCLPVFDGGASRFQPVFVGDIARFVEMYAGGAPDSEVVAAVAGRVVEAGGPEIYTYKELMQLVLKYSGRRRPIVSVPSTLAKLPAFFLEQLPPNLFSLTRDQIEQLKYDNVVAADSDRQSANLTLEDILVRFSDTSTGSSGLSSVHDVLPSYLGK